MTARHNLIEELHDTFRSRAREFSGLYLLEPSHAEDFIRAGLSKGLRLAGIESFRITAEGAVQPEQGFCSDRADHAGTEEQFVEDTLLLIRRGELAGVTFEVVFEGLSDHESL